MTSRFLSASMAAAMWVGLTVGALAQSENTSGRRQRKADDGAAAQAPADPTATESEPSFGSSQEATAKDPFDQAASKVKGSATKGGDSAVSSDSSQPKLEQATFGAGCFWHVEHDFEWLPGVKSAVSGYSGGHVPNPSYEMVHEGDTGHAEVVQVTYDPSVITYEQLLNVFWHCHNPTEWNRQGPDEGPQYRSVILYHSEAQRKAALKSYQQLVATRRYRDPIVTQLLPMKAFYRAEEYHQNYYGGKDDRPAVRSSRSRRTAKSAAKKGTTATAKAKSMKKESAASKSAGNKVTGDAPAPASPAGGDGKPEQ
jgi:peptide-methionine (S)-S-oxide reductase